MRDYPPPAEYEKMLGNPQTVRAAFKDTALRAVEVEKSPLGLPRARSGAFAVVYRAFFPDQTSCAVRLFLKDGDDRQERYQAVHDHLSRQSLACLVPFTYAADSFRAADGKWYPMMTMEWVKGETLFDWLQHRATAGDQKAIRSVTEQWQRTIQDLSRAQIAHGDLQHGNVMVTAAGDVKLVDYDGMCVPKLVGRRNLEIGVEPYQHPERDGDTKLSLSLDNFSSLFIYVGLRALAAEPRIWDEFVVRPEYDKMLFRKEDFTDPRSSALFQRLRRSPDADVQRLATALHELSRVRIDQVPFLDDLLFSWDQVRVVLDQRDFDAALALVNRGTKQIADAPATLQPKLHEAKERVDKLAALNRAVDAGDEARMAAEVGSPLLKDYPKASESVAAAVDAPAVLQALQKLGSARKAARGRDLVREWDAALTVLRKPKGSLRKSAAGFEADVEGWRRRNSLCDQILASLKTAEPDVSVLVTAWQDLARLGGHPESDAQKAAVKKLVDREKAWRRFAAVGHTVDETTDLALVAAWNENAFASWPRAQAERSRVVQAQTRLKAAAAVTQAAAKPLSQPGEEKLVKLAAHVPVGYSTTIATRVELARKRLAALEKLGSAVAADSDTAIAAAYRALQAEQADSLADSAQRPRIELATRREGALEKLRKIPSTYSNVQASQWDTKLLAAWDATLLAACGDATAWEPAVTTAMRRKQLLADLDRAVAGKDAFRAADIDDDPAIKGYLHADATRRFLQAASRDVSAVRGMLAALGRDDPAGFAAAFSARVVREHSGAFQPHWQKVVAWTRSEVLPTQRIGLAAALGVKGVDVRQASSRDSVRCTLRWRWPEPRYTDECRVLVCRDKPGAAASPDETPSLLKIPKTRELYESAGGFHAQQFSALWKGCYVVVWAKVDLGSTSLWSEPLVLGRV
jgi:hypothetical protein